MCPCPSGLFCLSPAVPAMSIGSRRFGDEVGCAAADQWIAALLGLLIDGADNDEHRYLGFQSPGLW